jgi:phospholipid/cholesterol/gamma-HCH transport system ATP-binding protein
VAVLADQNIVALGSVAEVARHPHPFIVEYFQGERGRRALGGLNASSPVPSSPAPL